MAGPAHEQAPAPDRLDWCCGGVPKHGVNAELGPGSARRDTALSGVHSIVSPVREHADFDDGFGKDGHGRAAAIILENRGFGAQVT
jgi:hypothetical protein